MLSNVSAEKKITFEYNNLPLRKVFLELIEKHNLSIIFPENIPNSLITESCEQCSIKEAISLILSSTPLIYQKTNSQYIIVLPSEKNHFSVSGIASDEITGEPIPYANVFIPKLNLGDISNHNGIFSISNISEKSCTLVVSYIGYETNSINLTFPIDEKNFQNVSLLPTILLSREISITGSTRQFMEQTNNPGQISFSPRHISTLPNLGEVDIFRSLQFLPGIQLGLGGTSNLYIRGGPPDQNLIMLDGMPIYQTGHMFGFISGISADAIKDIQVYKGGIPAKYGGRVSSVIELSSRSGNNSSAHGAIYGNLMSQGLTLEFPIFKRGNWILNFRKSNPSTNYSKLYTSIQEYITGDDKFNLLSQTANNINNQNSTYDIKSSYQDMINRFSFLVSPIHRFTVTHLNGFDQILEDRDYFGFNSILGDDTINIKLNTNLTGNGYVFNWSSKWNHVYNSHFVFSKYLLKTKYSSVQSSLPYENLSSNTNTAEQNNIFIDRSIKFHHEYKGLKNRKLSSGIEQTYLDVNFQRKDEDGTTNNLSNVTQNGFLHSFFVEDNWKINTNLKIKSGLRISYYNNNHKFHNEPRFAMMYAISSTTSLEVALGKHYQFVHQITENNNTRHTQNIWLISSDIIPSISSNNYHFGLNLEKNNYHFSMSIYKRIMQNVFQLQNHVISTNNEYPSHTNLFLGSGDKQGLELILRKKTGPLTGWISYNLNQTKYNFPDLNNGDTYLADYNRTNEIKTVIIAKIWGMDLTANWVYCSGGLYTDKNDMYIESGSGYEIITINNRNKYKLPPIHHLDINISRSFKILTTKIDIGCSIYNIYDKKNISHKRYNPYTSELSATNVSMFGITPNAYIKISI